MCVCSVERIRRGTKLVGSTLLDGVYVGPGESPLAHVERRERNLKLRYRIVRHGLGVCLPARGWIVESEWIVEVGSVYRNVVVEPVSTAEAHVAVAPRIETGEIARAALDRRRKRDFSRIDRHRSTGPSGIEYRIPLRQHLHTRKLLRLSLELKVKTKGLAERDKHVALGPRLISE